MTWSISVYGLVNAPVYAEDFVYDETSEKTIRNHW